MSKPKQNDYQKLKATWYAKLKDSGFKDIEQEDGSINSGRPHGVVQRHPVHQQAIREYYSMCYHFLNEYKFATELDRVIWEYHTEGLSIRNIVDTLNKAKITTLKRDSVWRVINELETIMKARYLSV